MKQMTSDNVFIATVKRVNVYLIIISAFFLIYFLFQTKVNIFLFLLALSYAAFALLSYKHSTITDRLSIELERARGTLNDVSKDMRDIHPDLNA
ncbi:MAG: hypothetical protein KKD29_01755 [Candidatus Omnitrophica bacterium]|nr:hypothetical protein [Candidatus Omnitrophota bacterium]